jgi:periplasmic protein TonB
VQSKGKQVVNRRVVGVVALAALLVGAPGITFASSTYAVSSQRSPERVSGGVLAAVAKHTVQPEYPEEAKKMRVSGSVIVEIVVDTNGNVVSVEALSGHPLLRAAAVDAARQWTFEPVKVDGTPVEVIGTLTFNFMVD